MEFLIIWFLFGIAAALVARNKNRSLFFWFFLGVLLGPFGLIFILILPKRPAFIPSSVSPPSPPAPFLTPTGDITLKHEMKQCPSCAESIKLEALKCRYCSHTFDPAQVSSTANARRHELQERASLILEGKFCPLCLQGDVRVAFLGNGTYGPWCPHCKKPVDLV